MLSTCGSDGIGVCGGAGGGITKTEKSGKHKKEKKRKLRLVDVEDAPPPPVVDNRPSLPLQNKPELHPFERRKKVTKSEQSSDSPGRDPAAAGSTGKLRLGGEDGQAP